MIDEIIFPRLLTPAEAAAALKKHPVTLRKWRLDGKGPRFTQIGGRFYYPEAEVMDFITQGMRQFDA